MSALPFEKIKRQVLIKKKSKTDLKFGTMPDQRKIEHLISFGVINLNKPKGPTSHQASDYVQKILKLRKAGHSGTLDPRVTGVLTVTTENATKVVQALLKAGKEYVCVMHLHKEVDQKKLFDTMKGFIGTIKQIPPLKSSVKREERERKIYYITVLEIDKQEVLFKVGCQAGTYIRKLCHDIGKKLGIGAHMADLVRTKAGPFTFEENLVTLQDLRDAYWYYRNEANEKFLRKCILPAEFAVSHLPKVWVLDSAVNSICHGADLKIPGVSMIENNVEINEIIAVMTLKNELVALGNLKTLPKHVLKKKKGVVVEVNKVLMKQGIYPKVKKEE